MNKKLLICLFLTTAMFIFADEYHSYDQELVKTFPIGSGSGEMRIDLMAPSDTGPSAVAFDEKGYLYISDILNSRVLVYAPGFELEKELVDLYGVYAKQLVVSRDNYLLTYSYHFSFRIDNFQGEKKAAVYLRNSEYRNTINPVSSYIYAKDIIFGYLKDGQIISIPGAGTNSKENLKKILDNEETHALFEEGSSYDLDGLVLDDKNRLFLNGELLTRDYNIYYYYWKNRHEDVEIEQPKLDITMTAEDYLKGSVTYLGKDKDGNVYWNRSMGISVFDKNGVLLDVFLPTQLKSASYPTVHPSGDIYYLFYDEENIYLYKITRRW